MLGAQQSRRCGIGLTGANLPCYRDGSDDGREPFDNTGRDAVDDGSNAERGRLYKAMGRYSAIGIEMGLAVGLGFVIGNWLDGQFDTQPYLTLTFILFGTVAGFRSLYRLTRRAIAEDKESN